MHFPAFFSLALVVQTVTAYQCYISSDQTKVPTIQVSSNSSSCSSYQYTCSPVYNFTCTPVEIAASAEKWYYNILSTASCLALESDGRSKNVCCCAYDYCNSPGAFATGCTFLTAPPMNNVTIATNGTTAKSGAVSDQVELLIAATYACIVLISASLF